MPFLLQVAAALDSGKIRKQNEDNYYRSDFDPAVDPKNGSLFLVVDGVGGNKGGANASLIACEQMSKHFFEPKRQKAPLSQRLRESIIMTHHDIVSAGKSTPKLREMSCTFVVVAMADGEAAYGNMGDSRIYRLRKGKLKQLSIDHSLVQEQLSLGMIDEEQARNHPHKNVVTRSLGGIEQNIPDIAPLVIQPDDSLVLCSDGLHGPVCDSQIAQIVGQSKNSAQIAHELVDEANKNGGPDNITAMAIKILSEKSASGITRPTLAIHDSDHLKPIGLTNIKTHKRGRFWGLLPW